MRHLVISFINPDRPGIVEQLSALIKAHHGNWQISSLHHLSGLFAGIIEVTVNEKDTDNLLNALNHVENLSLQVVLAPRVESSNQQKVVLDITANDRLGIVQEISSVIHQHNGNLIKLVSSQQSAAHTGQTMFNAKVHVSINHNALDILIEALENIADDLMIDINN
jgi:glycine cleavage system regulatory protein